MTQLSVYARGARFVMYLFAASLLVLTLCASRASADTFTSILNTPGSGTGAFPAPFGTVTVNLTSSNMATITFNAGSSGGFTYLFIDGGAADVQVNAASFTPTFVSATGPSTGGFSSPSFVSFAVNSPSSVDGFGNLNLQTTMFNGTDHPSTQIVFTVTDNSGTWASAANVLTTLNGVDAAAHVVVFNSNNVVNGQQITTGFVGETPGGVTPEPASMLLFGTGLVALGAKFRRQKRGNLVAA
jgi:PEP-CTERM motif-containing protein